MSFLDPLLDNFWIFLVIKLLLVVAVLLGFSLAIIYAELKVSAHMQSRIGPYFAGGRYGWAQPIADAVKFLQKEDLVPDEADSPVFRIAPMISLMSTVAVFVIVPFSPNLVAKDLNLGVFYALAAGSVGVVGILMAGWSSANKYSLMGGLRAAAQLIAYELPMVLAVVAVVVQAGTMSMVRIVELQGPDALYRIPGTDIGLPFVMTGQIVAFVIFMVAALAELNRTPFDMPIAESELVMGYLTEYSGIRFTMFFLAEYAGMFAMSAIAATLFLGGWYFPGLNAEILGPVVMMGKVSLLAFLMIWFRWTWPRFREDQLQSLAWRWLIPIALVNIVVTAIFKVAL
jgi:NADH-quinone oxidoreductase subunit H